MTLQSSSSNTGNNSLVKYSGIVGIIILVSVLIYQGTKKPEHDIGNKQTDDISQLNLEINNIKDKLETLALSQSDKLQFNTAKQSNSYTTNAISEIKNQILELNKKISEISNARSGNISNQPEPKVLSQEELQRKQELYNANIASLYTNTIETEQQDPQWSLGAEEKTRNALSAVSDKIEMQYIECKTTMCRLEISKLENTTDDEAMEAFESNINWSGAMNLTYDPKTGGAVVYLARDGYQLPELDN